MGEAIELLQGLGESMRPEDVDAFVAEVEAYLAGELSPECLVKARGDRSVNTHKAPHTQVLTRALHTSTRTQSDAMPRSHRGSGCSNRSF